MIGYSMVGVLVFVCAMVALRWHERRTYRGLNDWTWMLFVAVVSGLLWPLALAGALIAALFWYTFPRLAVVLDRLIDRLEARFGG